MQIGKLNMKITYIQRLRYTFNVGSEIIFPNIFIMKREEKKTFSFCQTENGIENRKLQWSVCEKERNKIDT